MHAHIFTREFWKALLKELTPNLYNRFHKINKAGALPNPFYQASLMPKPEKDNTNKQDDRLISLINSDMKIFNKILVN